VPRTSSFLGVLGVLGVLGALGVDSPRNPDQAIRPEEASAPRRQVRKKRAGRTTKRSDRSLYLHPVSSVSGGHRSCMERAAPRPALFSGRVEAAATFVISSTGPPAKQQVLSAAQTLERSIAVEPLRLLAARAVVVLHARSPRKVRCRHLNSRVRSHGGAPFCFWVGHPSNGKERGGSTRIPFFFQKARAEPAGSVATRLIRTSCRPRRRRPRRCSASRRRSCGSPTSGVDS